MNSKMGSNGPLIDDAILSLDPDQIFELQNIDQVKELVRKLQHETDRKREELRTLVGERYRDLMEAAETIICMRDTSSEVSKHLLFIQIAVGVIKSKIFGQNSTNVQRKPLYFVNISTDSSSKVLRYFFLFSRIIRIFLIFY